MILMIDDLIAVIITVVCYIDDDLLLLLFIPLLTYVWLTPADLCVVLFVLTHYYISIIVRILHVLILFTLFLLHSYLQMIRPIVIPMTVIRYWCSDCVVDCDIGNWWLITSDLTCIDDDCVDDIGIYIDDIYLLIHYWWWWPRYMLTVTFISGILLPFVCYDFDDISKPYCWPQLMTGVWRRRGIMMKKRYCYDPVRPRRVQWLLWREDLLLMTRWPVVMMKVFVVFVVVFVDSIWLTYW